MKRQRTIHLSFTNNDDDAVIHNELIRQSNLTFVPTSVIVREHLKEVMRNKGTLALN